MLLLFLQINKQINENKLVLNLNIRERKWEMSKISGYLNAQQSAEIGNSKERFFEWRLLNINTKYIFYCVVEIFSGVVCFKGEIITWVLPTTSFMDPTNKNNPCQLFFYISCLHVSHKSQSYSLTAVM